MASSSDEVPTKSFRLSNSKKLSSFDSVPNPNSQDRIRKKKPKSKSKSKTNKQRRRRRHTSSSSPDSDSDDYSSQKKKRRRKKEKELTKPDKKKRWNKKRRKRRHDTPSPSSTSPPRRPRSRKRRRSPSPTPSCSTCSSRGRSPPRAESREERAPNPLRGTEERWEDRDKIIEAYDDCPPSRNDEREAGAAGNDKLGNTRFASVVGSANDDMVEQEEEEKSVGVGNARLASVVCQADRDMVVEERKSAGSGDDAGKDAVDLELILRQKALENFRKFRGGLSANKESGEPAVNCRVSSSVEGGSMPSQPMKVHGSSDRKLLEQSVNKGSVGNHITSSSNEVGITTNQGKKAKGYTNRMLLSEHTTFAKVAQEKKLVAEPGGGMTHRAAVSLGDRKEEALMPVAEGKLRNPNSTETSKPTVSHTYSKSVEGGSMQNEAKRVEDSSNRLLSEQATLAKVAKDKTILVETGDDKAHIDAASIGDGSIPPVSCPIKDDENCKSNEHMVNSATGSQFEQKTFCRVRDGETVQVKYKVYIPKKTPALARRQLQR